MTERQKTLWIRTVLVALPKCIETTWTNDKNRATDKAEIAILMADTVLKKAIQKGIV